MTDDQRTPSPPYGYSRECDFNREQQVHIVAEFHAHKIRPSRIAFRMGIDIGFIEALIAGEEQPGRFEQLVKHYRKKRHLQRLNKSMRQQGIKRFETEQKIQREFDLETGL